MDNNFQDTALPSSEINNFLIRRLGEKEAAEVMSYINSEVDKQVDLRISNSHKEMGLWRDNMHKEFASKADADDLRDRLVKRVSKAESTLILWGIVFWITSLIALYCFLKFF
ncbi:MAG: hypothetical protein NVSMB45_11820 [Ginsengibacter sp.]